MSSLHSARAPGGTARRLQLFSPQDCRGPHNPEPCAHEISAKMFPTMSVVSYARNTLERCLVTGGTEQTQIRPAQRHQQSFLPDVQKTAVPGDRRPKDAVLRKPQIT